MEPTKKLYKINDGKLHSATLAELAEEHAEHTTTPHGVCKALHIRETPYGYDLCKWVSSNRVILGNFDSKSEAESARMEVLTAQFIDSTEGHDWSETEAEAWEWYKSLTE